MAGTVYLDATPLVRFCVMVRDGRAWVIREERPHLRALFTEASRTPYPNREQAMAMAEELVVDERARGGGEPGGEG